MQPDDRAPLKRGAIEHLLDTDHVTAPTRRALAARLSWAPQSGPLCFDPAAFATLEAVCGRLVPQPDPSRRVALAARLDERLAAGGGDGWRYDVLPPDRVATVQGVVGLEQTAKALFEAPFVALPSERQDRVLAAVQAGDPPGEVWRTLNAHWFFIDLLAQVTELYYAHPYAQEAIGFAGMADAQGFQALGLNRRDPVEDEASLAPL